MLEIQEFMTVHRGLGILAVLYPTGRYHMARILIILSILFSAAVFVPQADAEGGRLREMLMKRREAKGEDEQKGGLTEKLLEGLGGGTCADRKAQVDKLMSRGGKGVNAKSTPGDIVDVAYGDAPLQKLDVFYPKRKIEKLAPIIIMVHGGGWCVGDKTARGMTGNKMQHYTAKGFLYVSVNYPMVSEGSMALQQGKDVARAVAYVQKHAEEWGGDASRVILMGHSAGAHLVSLVNADAKIRAEAGVAKLIGTISLDSGTTNVVTQMNHPIEFMKERYAEAFGDEESYWIASSPFHQLDKTASPWLSICSDGRTGDPCGQSDEYAEKSNALGIPAQVIPVKKGHGAINNDLGKEGEYTDNVDKFIATLDPVVARYINE